MVLSCLRFKPNKKKRNNGKKNKEDKKDSKTRNINASKILTSPNETAIEPLEENLVNENQPVQEKQGNKENAEIEKNEKDISSSTTSSPSLTSAQPPNSKSIPTLTPETPLTNTEKDNNNASAQIISSKEIQESDNNDKDDDDVVDDVVDINDDVINQPKSEDNDNIQGFDNNNNIVINDDVIDQSNYKSFSNMSLGNVAGKAALQIFSASLLAAKPFFPWIESVTLVVNEIVVQYETVEYNKKTCLILVERVEMIGLSVKTLTRRREENLEKFQNNEYFHSFIRLQKVLKLVKDFIFDISELKGYRKFIYASEVKSKANNLLERLETCCRDLQFSIIITNEMREKEQRSLDEDVINMTKFLESIEEGVENIHREREKDSKIVNNIYEEVSVIRQMVSEFNGQTMFNAPTINPKDLYDADTDTSVPHEKNIRKKLLRNTIPVACKTVDKKEMDKCDIKKMQSHLSILKSIQPSNKIIKFHGKSEVNGETVLVFEWAVHGNLKSLYEKSPLDWKEKLNIAHDIASGLIFLQACMILHHDIRCENILITGDVRYEAKIANFQQSRENQDKSDSTKLVDSVIRWLAPEKLPKGKKPSKEKYTFKSEIFSFAMLLWELGAQKLPYENMQDGEIITHVMNKEREKFDDFYLINGLDPSNNSNESIIRGFKRIIESGWAHERNQRSIIKDIYQELDGLVGTHSPRMHSKYLSSDTITNKNSITPDEAELEDWKFIDPILPLDEGIRAHKRGEIKKAWKCFELHAALGDSYAIYWKAYYYLKGHYVKANTNVAIKYFKQAAIANIPEAQYYYANALERTKKPGFLEYYTKAANNGNYMAQYELGRFYYYGNGVEQNKEKGIQYLQLAALKKHPHAIKELKKIDPNLLVSEKEEIKHSIE